jgi:hypothetical protein
MWVRYMVERLVYDPTKDRGRKAETPLASEVVKAKIVNNEVKVKGKQPKAKRETKTKEKPAIAEPKPEKPKAEKKPTFTDEQFIETLRKIGKPATSREVSDALGIADPEVGRQLVRSRMAKLAEEGKVKITEAEKGRAKKVYSLA